MYIQKKEQQQTNKPENFYPKKESNKPNPKNYKKFIKKSDYSLLNIYYIMHITIV
jgi:hypothetical protein